jgi:hypothetical protein
LFSSVLFSYQSVLSYMQVSSVTVRYECSFLVHILVAYSHTDTQTLSVSSSVSSVLQLRSWHMVLAPSRCSSMGHTFPSRHCRSVAFSTCRGLPLSPTPGDDVSRVIS